MIVLRDTDPACLYNFMSLPTRPVIFDVRPPPAEPIRGSIKPLGPRSWAQQLLDLENRGQFDSCSPLVLLARTSTSLTDELAALTEAAEVVVSLTTVASLGFVSFWAIFSENPVTFFEFGSCFFEGI